MCDKIISHIESARKLFLELSTTSHVMIVLKKLVGRSITITGFIVHIDSVAHTKMEKKTMTDHQMA